MKNVFAVPLIFLSVFIASCYQNKSKNEESKKDIIIKQELTSGQRYDSIFLDYTFGMTQKEFDKHTAMLAKDKTIYVNTSGYYETELKLDERGDLCDAVATYSGKYFENKLYEMVVSVKAKQPIFQKLIHITAATLFQDKNSGQAYEEKSILDDKVNDYYYFKGNRQIKIIQAFDDTRIIYTDLLAAREREKVERSESQKGYEKTKSKL
jgi:hypothetical protein